MAHTHKVKRFGPPHRSRPCYRCGHGYTEDRMFRAPWDSDRGHRAYCRACLVYVNDLHHHKFDLIFPDDGDDTGSASTGSPGGGPCITTRTPLLSGAVTERERAHSV